MPSIDPRREYLDLLEMNEAHNAWMVSCARRHAPNWHSTDYARCVRALRTWRQH